MKMFTSILFAFFYLISSIGVAVNVHYCGGEVKDVAFYVDAESCCDDDVPCDCCDDKTFLIQNQKEDVISQSEVFSFSSIEIPLKIRRHDVLEAPKNDKSPSPFVDWTSPPESELWLKFCTLTYYG